MANHVLMNVTPEERNTFGATQMMEVGATAAPRWWQLILVKLEMDQPALASAIIMPLITNTAQPLTTNQIGGTIVETAWNDIETQSLNMGILQNLKRSYTEFGAKENVCQ